MSGEPQDIFRDERGRYKPGFNTGITRRMRIAAKLEELCHEFFPSGGESRMDASRLRLAAHSRLDANVEFQQESLQDARLDPRIRGQRR